MIPQFPNFKKLELTDKEDVESFTKDYLPYSDFNFTSLWSWDTKEEKKISLLDENLVIKFTDYISSQPFYTFIGSNNVSQTAETLIKFSEQESLPSELHLIPEVVANKINRDIFIVEENEDHFDYVYEMEKLQNYEGNRLRSKRNLHNRFKRKYNAEIKIIDCFEVDVQKAILDLFDIWVKNKGYINNEFQNELAAFKRLFMIENINLVCVGIYIDNQLKGFIVNEIMPKQYTILHFEKADDCYDGIYSYLMAENARILNQIHKRTYLNYEQDLGIPGLRLGKRSYRPCHFLKKYSIRLR